MAYCFMLCSSGRDTRILVSDSNVNWLIYCDFMGTVNTLLSALICTTKCITFDIMIPMCAVSNWFETVALSPFNL